MLSSDLWVLWGVLSFGFAFHGMWKLFVKKVSYVDKNGELERRIQKIYDRPLQHRKRAILLLPVAVVVLVLAVYLVYKPVGEAVIHWLADVVSTQVREGAGYGKL